MKWPGRLFRKGTVRDRRDILVSSFPRTHNGDFALSGSDGELLDLADAMVEQAVGYMGVPLGLAGPFLVDGTEVMIPMCTEEPSVIAAATFAGTLLSRHGGIITGSAEPVMTSQIFVEDIGTPGEKAVEAIRAAIPMIQSELAPLLESMERRGGGWRSMDARWIAPSKTLAIDLRIDVRDAMGANLLNSAAESIRPLVEKITGGKVLMAILSNRSLDRTATARFSLPAKELGRNGFDGEETAKRIIRAAKIAREDPNRAVTHNKGIMNGISALALATGNDTRAIEAAVHAYAGRYGPYHGLTEYWIEDGMLEGMLELPLPFASTGGAVGFHPVTRWSLEAMGNPDATTLSRYAAALGLAQNLSALRALVSEGIQQGHMGLHARRLAFDAGARGDEIPRFAQVIREENIRNRRDAAERLTTWKVEDSHVSD